MRLKIRQRDRRKMLLHGLGARLAEFNRSGIAKEKKIIALP
jgi:hypothetical protein